MPEENPDTLQDVFYENIETNSQVSSDLQDFMELLNHQKETEEKEKIEQQKLEEAAQKELEKEKKEEKELTTFYKTTLTDANTTNSELLAEVQTLNENFLLENEKQNALHAESTIMIVLAIVISLSMQSFFNQLTKW